MACHEIWIYTPGLDRCFARCSCLDLQPGNKNWFGKLELTGLFRLNSTLINYSLGELAICKTSPCLGIKTPNHGLGVTTELILCFKPSEILWLSLIQWLTPIAKCNEPSHPQYLAPCSKHLYATWSQLLLQQSFAVRWHYFRDRRAVTCVSCSAAVQASHSTWKNCMWFASHSLAASA